ncbi:hypothetical protein BC937DRAFT_94966 [Endogone sp. FLAS-F59071]|nr:hypothetical protein BC937DRAFT_94966 [Endogone sp. FLAS-F59071]|eukprot:RUS22917.1 hypothetical protein BC937DRAFT_94966 [Endogone sp. FLAS-F59071]
MSPFRRGANYDPLTPLSQRSFYRPNLINQTPTSRRSVFFVAAFVIVVLFVAMLLYGSNLRSAAASVKNDQDSESELVVVQHPTALDEAKRKVDQKYCGMDKCRFLVPVVIIEQETKSQMHFRHLSFLSNRLNRTIVLPNVGSAFLGLCRPHTFTYYFSISWLDVRQEAGQIRYILREDYEAWLSERAEITTAEQDMRPAAVDINVLWNASMINSGVKEQNCWAERLTYEGWGKERKAVVVADGKLKNENPTEMLREGIVRAVKNGKGEEPEVVNVWYDRRTPFIDDAAAQQPLSYAKHWTTQASALTDPLAPLIAVHWRMEGIQPVAKLAACARNLTEHIRRIAQREPHTVYFLTDYPHLLNLTGEDVDSIGTNPESETFNAETLTSEHHEAVAVLYGTYNISMSYLSTPETESFLEMLREQIPSSVRLLPVRPPPATGGPDHSTLGIVDKVVAMQARWFLAGRGWECARYSSYTQQIVRERRRKWEVQGLADVEGGIANVVEYW